MLRQGAVRDTLISRKRHAVSVSGVSYLKADQKTNSPTNTELGERQELVTGCIWYQDHWTQGSTYCP